MTQMIARSLTNNLIVAPRGGGEGRSKICRGEKGGRGVHERISDGKRRIEKQERSRVSRKCGGGGKGSVKVAKSLR